MLGTRGDSASLGRVGRARVVGSALVFVVLGVTWLSGCDSGAASPPPLETSTRSPSATPSPTPAAPTLPAEAKGTTEASAEAFVRHWIDVLNYSGPAGDPKAIRALSSEACSACSAIADFVEGIAADGGEIAGEGWEIREVSMVTFQPGRSAVLDVVTTVHPQRVTTSESANPEDFPGGKRLKTFWLEARGSGWALVRLDQPQ